MPRKKTVKRKNKLQSNALTLIQKMEKDFLRFPAELAKQLSKEIATNKQKENKLKKLILQLTNQLKNSENRLQANSNPIGANAKKQLQAAKKAYTNNIKAKALIEKELVIISKQLQTAALKQAKFIAVGKNIQQFEKEWSKQQVKTISTVPKTKIKKTINKKPAAQHQAESTQTPSMEVTDNIASNEVTTEVM